MYRVNLTTQTSDKPTRVGMFVLSSIAALTKLFKSFPTRNPWKKFIDQKEINLRLPKMLILKFIFQYELRAAFYSNEILQIETDFHVLKDNKIYPLEDRYTDTPAKVIIP